MACLQLRLKDTDDAAIRRAAGVLQPLCQDRDVAFLVNDRPDIAAGIGADGVHIGQDDADYDEARALVGADATVGVTCHDSYSLALTAAEQGADYVAFGAFFPSGTKRPKTAADPQILRDWGAIMTVPSVAIGGITAANCRPLVEAGADFLAVVSGVWNHPAGPAAAVRAFGEAIAEAEAAR